MATIEINLANYIGSAYAEQTEILQQAPAGNQFGIQLQGARVKAAIAVAGDKAKHTEGFTTLEQWRTR